MLYFLITGNMDQTMCRFDMAPKRTNNLQGEKTIRIATTGGAKRGFTVALSARANGEKHPAFVVFRERNGIIPPRVMAALRVPRNIRIAASPNGWMTGEFMRVWVNRIWGQNVDDIRRLLVLDRARIHTMQATLTKLDEVETDVVFIPGRFQKYF
jgi:hypothetical protein